ncbi:YopT-type cysteine protease domain-containing protein [Fodinicurvata sp. EGI_FJ10296]|uniref:YopT-type cysteine protease domain-containing protein n=1 Tax=Fodinicurvata sp. EGI_FJ10296 TaxID=3231908 RepID=UPI0034544EA5
MTTLNSLLVAPFSQASLLGRHYSDEDASLAQRQAERGVCYALTAKWIARHRAFKSEGPTRRIEFLSTEDSIVDAMQTQIFAFQNKTALLLVQDEAAEVMERGRSGIAPPPGFVPRVRGLMARMGTDRGEAMMSQAFEMHGLARTPTLVDGAALTDTSLTDRVRDVLARTNSVHTYHQISVEGPGKGHAICCYKSGGGFISSAHLYLFDPNYGEYKIKESLIQGALKVILERFSTNGYDKVSVAQIN